jgi:hypothetical protein
MSGAGAITTGAAAVAVACHVYLKLRHGKRKGNCHVVNKEMETPVMQLPMDVRENCDIRPQRSLRLSAR